MAIRTATALVAIATTVPASAGPDVTTTEAERPALAFIDAAVSVIVDTTALAAMSGTAGCARSCFVGNFIDVLVAVANAAVTARCTDAIAAVQVRQVALRVRASRLAAAKSRK
ncbi:MAG TPA: hypothetical protein VJR89_23045 [Polyangiales bacterium]|nr:hypothetical protein [Polyangiales bacterium]